MSTPVPSSNEKPRYVSPPPLVYIEPSGKSSRELPAQIDLDWLRQAYQHMSLIRALDKKAVALQRTGQMRTYPSCLGQEAVGIGTGMAMIDADIYVPYYRDQATLYLRGVQLKQILQLWGGDERGHLFDGAAKNDLPICVPIATQLTQAAGAAVALKSKGVKGAVVTSCGDGATSRGDFYEALNVAGLWQLPMVTVINNNQWAISVPRQMQSGTPTLAQKAVAAGIEGIQVDGNDVVAVFDAVNHALQKARSGKGPTLIEAITYRLGDHTTADDATRYRSASEVSDAWQREPIKRLQTWLHDHDAWDATREQSLHSDIKQQIERAVADYLAIEPAPVDDILRYQYANMTPALEQQRAWLLQRHGG
jgi:2-oxoisovalerate dehydrogenase E1 component alpha subunit